MLTSNTGTPPLPAELLRPILSLLPWLVIITVWFFLNFVVSPLVPDRNGRFVEC
jgi:hypothetical protein